MNQLSRVAVLVMVALGVLAPVAPAPAQADPIGEVIVISGSGSDLSAIRVRTSAGCPAKANAYYAELKSRDFPPVFCVDSFTLKEYGEFTGSLEFTSPTCYEALGVAKPSGSPPLEQAGDGSALASEMAPPPAGKPPVAGPPRRTVQGPATLAPTTQPQPGSDPGLPLAVGQLSFQRSDATGQGVPWLVLVGVVLVAGVVVAVTNRIRKRRPR